MCPVSSVTSRPSRTPSATSPTRSGVPTGSEAPAMHVVGTPISWQSRPNVVRRDRAPPVREAPRVEREQGRARVRDARGAPVSSRAHRPGTSGAASRRARRPCPAPPPRRRGASSRPGRPRLPCTRGRASAPDRGGGRPCSGRPSSPSTRPRGRAAPGTSPRPRRRGSPWSVGSAARGRAPKPGNSCRRAGTPWRSTASQHAASRPIGVRSTRVVPVAMRSLPTSPTRSGARGSR